MTKSIRHSMFLATAALVVAPYVALAQEKPAQSEDAQSDDFGIRDIVVTAQRREQRLQDVPISISALDETALLANRVQNLRDLSGVTPNLTVRTSVGGSALPVFVMRGLYTMGSAAGQDRGVAVYIDGVYLGAASGSLFDLADISRVEVLKGPQGTLFGRNSTGGAISFTTRDPEGHFGIHQELTYGNYDQFRARTRVSLPQLGPFSAVVTYTHDQRDGDIRNRAGGTIMDLTAANGGTSARFKVPKTLNGRNNEAVQGTIKADLSDNLVATYKGDWSESKFTQASSFSAYEPGYFTKMNGGALAFMQPYFDAAFAGSYNGIAVTAPAAKRPKEVNNITSVNTVKAWGHNLTAVWKPANDIVIKNILSMRKSEFSTPFNDFGGLGLFGSRADLIPVPALAAAYGTVGSAAILFGAPGSGSDKQWSNELQFVASTDWFTLTVGYMHFQNKSERGFFGTAGTRQILGPLSGQPASVYPLSSGGTLVIPSDGSLPSSYKTVSDAVYMQNELHLTDTLELVLGGRLTKDRKSGIDNQALGVTDIFSIKVSEPTYLVGLNWKPTGDALVYGKFSTGYISGGKFATLAYGSEKAKSWEGGLKADWFGRKLRTNLSLFHVEYTDQQISGNGLQYGIPAASQVIVNASDSRAYGFEFESTLAPVRGLTLNANVGYTNFKFKRIDPRIVGLATGIDGLTRFHPNSTPKWTGSFAAQYDTVPLWNDVNMTFRTDASYTSKSYAIWTPISKRLEDINTVKANWMVNGRITLNNIEVAGVKSTLALWGRNIFDNRTISYGFPLVFMTGVNYQPARTFGVDLSFDF